MTDELRNAKRAAEASRAAGLCPICDHAPHRDTPCPGCPCTYSKTLHAQRERFSEAFEGFTSTFRESLLRAFRRHR